MKQTTEGRQTSWLCISAAEELNQGLPRTNPASVQSWTWKSGALTTRPRCLRSVSEELTMKRRNLYRPIFLNQLQRHKMKHKIKNLQSPCSQLHQLHPPTEKKVVPVRLLNSSQETAAWDFLLAFRKQLVLPWCLNFATKCYYHGILEKTKEMGAGDTEKEICQSW